jgi:hypothetical protein
LRVGPTRFKEDFKDVAEYLYDLLATPAMALTPVLVVCNKQDMNFRAGDRLLLFERAPTFVV